MKTQARPRHFPAISFATFLPAIGFALVLLIYWVQQPLILSDFGIVSLCNQSVALALAAMAQTLVVLTGGIDLSVGSLISLTTCFAATYMGTSPETAVPVIVATLLLGVLTGAVNGILVVLGRRYVRGRRAVIPRRAQQRQSSLACKHRRHLDRPKWSAQ